jgi:hypothetical protein
MGRGTPDYNDLGYSLGQQSLDTNSIVNAIAGVAPMDAQGRIVYHDVFHQGMASWTVTVDNDGSYVRPTTLYAEVPGGCLDVNCAYAGGDDAIVSRSFYLAKPARVGIEAAVRASNTNWVSEIGIHYWDGAYHLHGSIVIDDHTGHVTMAGQEFTPKLTVPLTLDKDTWIPHKIVLDLTNRVAVRVNIGYNQYVINQSIIFGADTTQPGRLQIELRNKRMYGQLSVYFGHVFWTIDEP